MSELDNSPQSEENEETSEAGSLLDIISNGKEESSSEVDDGDEYNEEEDDDDYDDSGSSSGEYTGSVSSDRSASSSSTGKEELAEAFAGAQEAENTIKEAERALSTALERLRAMQERAVTAEETLDKFKTEMENERLDRERETQGHLEELRKAREAEERARAEVEELAASQKSSGDAEEDKRNAEVLRRRVEEWEAWYRQNYEHSLGVVQTKIESLKATWDKSLRDLGGSSLADLERVMEDARRSEKLMAGRHGRRVTDSEACLATLNDFKMQLVLRHGSLTKAWSRSLDVEGEGRIPFTKFCRTAREIGFAGSVQQLWRQLDFRKTGFISLSSLDEVSGHKVQRFRQALIDKFGSLPEGWGAALDTTAAGVVETSQFSQRCRESLEMSDGREIASVLDLEKSGVVTLEDLDPPAFEKWLRDPAVGRASGRVPFKLFQRLARHSRIDPAEMKPEAFSPSRGPIKLLAQLRRDYGTLGRAWSTVIDPQARGCIPFLEFARFYRAVGQRGPVKKLWLRLGAGAGPLRLEHIDPDAAALIEDFKGALRRTTGSLGTAWRKIIDPKEIGRVTWVQWHQTLRPARGSCSLPARFNDAEIRELFNLFDPEGCGYITLEDVDREEFQDGIRSRQPSFSVQASDYHAKTVNFLSATSISPPLALDDEHEMYPVEILKHILIEKFGSVARAWIQCLDSSGAMKVEYLPFCGVLTALGFPGKLKQLWVDIGELKDASICLQAVDPGAFELIMRFRQGVRIKHGLLAKAWAACLNPDDQGRVSPDVFVDQCASSELLDNFNASDANLLLGMLRLDSTESLAITELDPRAMDSFKEWRQKLQG
ncbi:hypothetical protein FOL47_004410 [Perkinsus chesapeaki]|uniref:EF-hand domain-containing protein n=1 Tax=Perkinsus chesapeaki TaxID=330153 RepID=A0A7J6M2Z9_PERCH|nr:hypothetical protein FOL47_004410 [Perkinsus chesapeaki]